MRYKPLKQLIQEGRDSMLTSDRTKLLNVYPHYSDPTFFDPENKYARIERHVFLADGHKLQDLGHYIGVKGAAYDYSDRLSSWELDSHKKAKNYADSCGFNSKTAAWFEDYLCGYFGRPVELVHIVVGINVNGWPYQVFGYID